ncbi:glucosamine-6-phosphate deaminase [Paenibacillus sp. GM2]|uniref:glucosamine-6-phosphate deaminase n=1 Tax=Paenibacillus sp. GM2 TaxID=1622070 RepID=UPI0008399A08|nr:glucosamine-6-phosphate deaminase [Paenibacillus sp. GM2]
MRIIVEDTEEQFHIAAALEIAKQIVAKPDSVITFAGGETTVGVHRELAQLRRQWRIDFSKMKAFTLDEYVGLSPDDPRSVSYRIRHQVLNPIGLQSDHIYMPDGMAEDLQQACTVYDRLLDEHPVDLEILGIGSNGHIGFNEPGTPFHLDTHVIHLASHTTQDKAGFFGAVGSVPEQGITVGIRRIMRSKQILLLAKGKGKSEIIRQALMGPITTDVPASVLQLHPSLTIIMDKAAAELL